MTDWSSTTIENTAQRLNADPHRGLSADDSAFRLNQHGPNQLPEKAGHTLWQMLISQFQEFLVLLLIGAAAVSLLLGESTDAIVIFIVVTINAVLGVTQEYKAEKSLAALKNLSPPMARVLRDGSAAEIPAQRLVPGDLILLSTGDFIPADARLVESVNLKINESALTGESEPVRKDPGFVAARKLPLAERKNMVFMGTTVSYGKGKALVTGTGLNTEIGQIAYMLQTVKTEKTPLQQKLAGLSRQLGLLAIIICLVIFILGALKGNGLFEMFLTSVSLAVAAIPEGLPAIVTIVLAAGVQRMSRQRAIIRKLPAVETLGAATVICSDKTGTLTQNAMTVRRIAAGGKTYQVTGEGYEAEGKFIENGRPVNPRQDHLLSLILKVCLLSSDARLVYEQGTPQIAGDPTEGALVVAAAKAGFYRDKLCSELPKINEFPFDPERKRASTIHRGEFPEWPGDQKTGCWVLAKGAPDLIIDRCRCWLSEQGPRPLTSQQKAFFKEHNLRLAGKALRVLGLAIRPASNLPLTADQAEAELYFIGLVGMIDPIRPEAYTALEECRKAGIQVKMITGDHRNTALAIGRQLKLATDQSQVITGLELDRISQAKLVDKVSNLSIFARVSPAHKVRIVDALKTNGEIVAMTGDGINDAPALKRADIGTAMGKTGTDVAKEAADMILADDNFATIVQAVREGRVIFENIRKAVYFLLSTNSGEILTILAAILLRWPLPLMPIQILWINLVTDSLPALSLGVEPAEPGTMNSPPRDPEEGIFGPRSRPAIVFFGVLIALTALISFRLGLNQSLVKGRTMAFATLSLSQLVHVFNFRSLNISIFKQGLSGNRPLVWSVLVSAAAQLAVLLVPSLMSIFRTGVLTAADWLIISGLILLPLAGGELWKLFSKNYYQPNRG
ncbi:MAG TPA: cation-translocating P-type ATPase [Firmicutes bacterium]|nr:cation-translocating P-type ATPase [Bacillota bacterium]